LNTPMRAPFRTPSRSEQRQIHRQQRFAEVENGGDVPSPARLLDSRGRANNAAAVLPAGPPPITATSHCSIAVSAGFVMLPSLR